MADWRESSDHYLRLHQIGAVWEGITHALVKLKPTDVLEFTIQKLETLKTQKDVPGRRLVFLLGGPGADAHSVAESLVADDVLALNGDALINDAGGSDASAENVALELRRKMLASTMKTVFVTSAYPQTISQALLTEIQVTPCCLCIYLQVDDSEQAAVAGISEAEVKAQMQAKVNPLIEYFKAKQSLVTVEKSEPTWFDKVKDIVTKELKEFEKQ